MYAAPAAFYLALIYHSLGIHARLCPVYSCYACSGSYLLILRLDLETGMRVVDQ